MKIVITLEEAVPNAPTSASAAAYVAALQEAADLYLAKSVGYGETWREQGWMGNLARLMSKASRLRNMAWRRDPLVDSKESVEDTLLDLVNLSIFGLLNRRDGNFWGSR